MSDELRNLIGRTADYIVNERDSAILHTVVCDTLESFASDVGRDLRNEASEWKKLALEQDRVIRDMRESCAKVVEQTIAEMRLGDNQWARAGLLFAARAVRRGRHLTPEEKLENFKKAMAETDEEDEA